MASKKRFDLNDPRDIRAIQELLLDGCNESDDEDQSPSCSASGPTPGPSNINTGDPEEDCDTDAEEEIEERQENSDTEQSDDDSSSEDDKDEDYYVCQKKKGKKVIDTITWKKSSYPPSKTGKHNLIRRLPGPIGRARGINTIADTWACLFDDSMFEIIVTYTNQYIDSIKGQYTRERDAKATNKTEIKACIGLLYLAGLYKAGKLNLEDLWGKDGFGIEIFRLTMTLTRFRFLLRTLRFDNRETRQERRAVDRLAHIRELFEKFIKNCKESYHVGEDVTVDEKLEGFRGRCSFIQYIPSKPAKYGVKIFAVVDSGVYYTCNMEIYPGKQPDGPFQLSNKPADVVERLVAHLRNSGRNVTADNWFSDITLLQNLSKKYGLSYVGTLKKNKWQIPKEMKELKTREAFSSVFAFRKEATMVSYVPQNKNNKKNVLLISSMHSDGSIDEDTENRKKPEIITYYNHHKIGVDMVDKMSSAYNVQRGTRRWPMVVFSTILNVAGINSQIIYLGNGNEVSCRRNFIRDLGRELIMDQMVIRSQLARLPRSLTIRLRELLPGKQTPRTPSTSTTTGANEKKRKRCEPCWGNKITRVTKYTCNGCGQYLCLKHSAYYCIDGCDLNNNDENDEDSSQQE